MADIELIKPRELPEQAQVFAGDAIMVDNGTIVGKATPEKVVNAGAPVATEAEALAGVNNTKRMTPLRTKQVLDNLSAPAIIRAQAWAESPTAPDPLLPDSKSSKTWAGVAKEYADKAEQGTVMVQWSCIAAAGQTVLGGDITTGEPIRAYGGVAQISVNGFGPLTAAEYSVASDGVITLTSALAEGDIVSGFTQPRLTNSDAQAVVQGVLQQTADDVRAAQEILDRIDLGALDAAVQESGENAERARERADSAMVSEGVSNVNASLAIESADLIWSYSDLFSNSESGFYIPDLTQDSGNAFTDVARTTQAKYADRVASLRLKTSGSDMFAEQSTAGNRPYLGVTPLGGARNIYLNSSLTGAASGTPGTLPRGFTVAGGTASYSVVGFGVDSGVNYIDIRITGAPGTAGVINLSGGGDGVDPVAAPNQNYAFSFFGKVVAGSLSNVTRLTGRVNWRTAGGASSISASAESAQINTSDYARLNVVAQTSASNAGTARPQILMYCTGDVDFTLRLGGIQVEKDEVTNWQYTNTQYHVSESGVAGIPYIATASASGQLSVTLSSAITTPTRGIATSSGTSVDLVPTISSGSYGIFTASPQSIFGMIVSTKMIVGAEKSVLSKRLDASRGDVGGAASSVNKPIRIDELGYRPADGDVGNAIREAMSLGTSKTIIIPYYPDPWVLSSKIDLNIDDLELVCESGARISQDHTIIGGIELSANRVKVDLNLTSTLYAYNTLASVSGTAASSNSHGRRSVVVSGDNCVVLGLSMEYAAQGLTITGSHARVMNPEFRYLRSYEGWASAINIKPTAIGTVIIGAATSDCDRAYEPEDGARFWTFESCEAIRIESRWFDCTTTQSETFVYSAHSHDDNPSYTYTGDGRYINCYAEDCATVVQLIASSGGASRLPRRIEISGLRIKGATTSALSNPYPMIMVEGFDNIVEWTFEGVPLTTTRGVVNQGSGNTLIFKGGDSMSVPMMTTISGAEQNRLVFDATELLSQPVASGTSGIFNPSGRNTSMSLRCRNVQNINLVVFQPSGSGSVVEDMNVKVPTSGAGAAVIRFNASSGCMVLGGTVDDPSSAMQLARFVGGSTGNVLMSVLSPRTSGQAVALDSVNGSTPSANNNKVVNNILGSGTVSNGGTGNTISNL